MLQFIYGAVLWVIVPAIMVSIFIFNMVVCSRAIEKRSAWAGFFLGLIIFVLYIISNLSLMQNVDFTSNSLPIFDETAWMLLGGGGLIGFVLLFVIRVFRPTRGIGIVSVCLTAASTCSLFSYLFIASIRETALFFAIGILCGVLIHIILIPDTLPDIFKESDY